MLALYGLFALIIVILKPFIIPSESHALYALGAFSLGIIIAGIYNKMRKKPALEEVTESRVLVKRY